MSKRAKLPDGRDLPRDLMHISNGGGSTRMVHIARCEAYATPLCGVSQTTGQGWTVSEPFDCQGEPRTICRECRRALASMGGDVS